MRYDARAKGHVDHSVDDSSATNRISAVIGSQLGKNRCTAQDFELAGQVDTGEPQSCSDVTVTKYMHIAEMLLSETPIPRNSQIKIATAD